MKQIEKRDAESWQLRRENLTAEAPWLNLVRKSVREPRARGT